MKSKRPILFSCFVGIIAILAAPSVYAQTYASCDQWGNTTNNGYTIYNNIWGSGAGSQCLTVNAYNNWYVDANHPNTGGIKSYPNVEKRLSVNVDAMGSLTSTFAVTRPTDGAYASTYDIWFDNYNYEVMLWMNKTGAVGPIATAWDANGNPIPEVTNVTVGGHAWNVYKGSNGANQVFSFVRTANTNSGTVDIAAIARWIRGRNWFANANLHSVQFGFEITSSNGSRRYSVTNFAVASASPTLTVSPASMTFGAGASSQTATITSNIPWTVSDNQSWISVGTASGTNNGSTAISVSANGSATRTGTVTIAGGGLTRTVGVTQTGSVGPTPDTYQAESVALAGGAVAESNYSGYRGTGFVNLPPNGGSVTFNNVDGNGGGTKNLAIRYALGATASRTCNLVVNGTTRTITFAPTGAWTTWATLTVSITLANNSTNSIRIASTGGDGGNIDEITVP